MCTTRDTIDPAADIVKVSLNLDCCYRYGKFLSPEHILNCPNVCQIPSNATVE